MPVPKISIELDYQERFASFTLGAMCDFKEETGVEITSLGSNMTPAQIRAFLWACLRVHDKSITLEEVGDLISVDDLATIVERLMSLAGASSPEPGDEVKNA
jgi:hypothetical protein